MNPLGFKFYLTMNPFGCTYPSMTTQQTTIDMRKKEREVWNWIKYKLTQIDSSFLILATQHGVRLQNLTFVKHHTYPKYERIIADHIGFEPWELWPARYDAANNPARVSPRYPGHKNFVNDTRFLSKSNVKNERENCRETDKN